MGPPGVEVEQAIMDAGERAGNELRRFLRVFNGLATISPLLGLLGTVFGIIRAFNDIAVSDAMGRMEMLSHRHQRGAAHDGDGPVGRDPVRVPLHVFQQLRRPTC